LATVTVHVADDVFTPSAVTIQPGDTVRWVWDEGIHSTTSVAGSAETWDSGVHTPSFTFDHTFTTLGTFSYYCSVHGFDRGNGTAGGMSGTITVGAPAALQSIAVTPVDPSLVVGATQQFTATGVFSDRSTRDLTGQVTWASATPSVATISNTGAAIGLAQGSTVVTASLTGVTGSTLLTVATAPQAPTLTGEQRLFSGRGRRQRLIGFELRFSAPLDGAVASDVSHYQVVQPGRNRRSRPMVVRVQAASYNAVNNSVTLRLGRFNVNRPLTLTATGLIGVTGAPVPTIVTRL
jgi:plastocyanin